MADYLGLDNLNKNEDINFKKLDMWGNSLGVRIPRETVRLLDLEKGMYVSIEKKSGEIHLKPIIDGSKLVDFMPYFIVNVNSEYLKLSGERDITISSAQGILKKYLNVVFIAENYFEHTKTSTLFSSNILIPKNTLNDSPYILEGNNFSIFSQDIKSSLSYDVRVEIPIGSECYIYYDEKYKWLQEAIVIVCDFKKTLVNGRALYSYISENERLKGNKLSEIRAISKKVIEELKLKNKKIILGDFEGVITGKLIENNLLEVKNVNGKIHDFSLEHIIDILSQKDKRILSEYNKVIKAYNNKS